MKSLKITLSPYDLPLALFLISALLGLWAGYDPSIGSRALIALWLGGLLVVALSRLAMPRIRWDWVALGLVLLNTALSIYFITQSGRLGVEDKVAFLARISNFLSSISPDIAIWKPLANSVATFLEGGLFLQLALAFIAKGKARRSLLYISSALTATALLLASSRGAWLAVLVAGLIWAALYWKPAKYLAILMGLGMALLVTFVLIKGDITAINQIPVANTVLGPLFIRPDRLEVYRNSIALIADVPFSGIGLGNQFGLVYSRYELFLPVPYLYYSHNLFLETWLEQGLLGIFAWVWLWAAIITTAILSRYALKFDDFSDRLRFESTWVALIAVLVHGISDARQYQSLWCWLPFFIFLGLNGALILEKLAASHTGSFRWSHLAPASVALLFLLITFISLKSLPAAVEANQGSTLQERADLAPGLSSNTRVDLRQQARSKFLQVLAIQPDNRTASQRLGQLYLGEENFTDAITNLKRAVLADPRHPGARKTLGLAYTFSGDLDAAQPLLQDVSKITDELNYFGWYYSTTSHPQAGLNAYLLSLRINPDQPDVKTQITRLSQSIQGNIQ